MASLSLADHLAEVPDPRRGQGKRHSMAAILRLTAVAMMCGMRSLHAIAQFGRLLPKTSRTELGFTHDRTPCKSTLSEVLRLVDLQAFEQTLRRWAGPLPQAEHLCIDGKTLRGSADGDVAAVHLLSIYATAAGVTVAQMPVGDKTNEHKAALQLLRQTPLQGAVVSGDAMFTHRDVCQTVLDGGGEYLLPVKDNQPTLRRDIAATFAPREGLSPPANMPLRR